MRPLTNTFKPTYVNAYKEDIIRIPPIKRARLLVVTPSQQSSATIRTSTSSPAYLQVFVTSLFIQNNFHPVQVSATMVIADVKPYVCSRSDTATGLSLVRWRPKAIVNGSMIWNEAAIRVDHC